MLCFSFDAFVFEQCSRKFDPCGDLLGAKVSHFQEEVKKLLLFSFSPDSFETVTV